jgi:hypothetical protein
MHWQCLDLKLEQAGRSVKRRSLHDLPIIAVLLQAFGVAVRERPLLRTRGEAIADILEPSGKTRLTDPRSISTDVVTIERTSRQSR